MNDITREEAIKILKDTLYDEKTPTDYLKAVRMGREALENQKTGHWIMQGLSPYEGYIRCSECGAVYDIKRVFKYCPNCGAKMEGENNE